MTIELETVLKISSEWYLDFKYMYNLQSHLNQPFRDTGQFAGGKWKQLNSEMSIWQNWNFKTLKL